MIRRWAQPTPPTRIALAISIGLTLGTAAYLWLTYATLPLGVPVRFVAGQALIYQVKSPLLVMLPAVVQAALLTVFGGIMLLLLWRARPEHAESDPDSERMRHAAEGIALLAAVWIGVQALGAVRLVELWRRRTGGYGELYTFAMLTAIVVSVIIGARTLKLVGRQQRSRQSESDDPTVWRMRQLYFNPKNPALFVPTRTGGGWTLNFGRPVAIVMLAAVLIAGIGAPYALALYMLRGFGN